jgi:streptogramin lyase
MSSDPRIGTVLAGYRIESVIGRGGMGVVYLAEQLRLSRSVALKILPPELAEDERFRDRFIHESKLAASLDHPNIVDIYDAGEADGLLYLAMRYVGGSDLKTLIAREGALGPARAVALLAQIASALDAAHGRGLVHRDIKTANVLVEPAAGSLGEHAYLTDFGLTKRPESMSGLTRTGQFLGSVEYAAPEQFEGKPIDARTDIYSLGCVAYESLTGELPFRRDSDAAVMYAHLRDAPPKVTDARPDLPAGLGTVVKRAMAKSPDDRYLTAGALADALGAASRGELVASRAPARRSRRPWILAGAALLVLGAVLSVLLISRGGKEPGGSTPATKPVLIGALHLTTDGRVVHGVPIPFGISDVPFDKSIAIGDGAVWVLDDQVGSLFKISPSSNTIVATLRPKGPLGIVSGGGSEWVGPDFFAGQAILSRVDPATNAISDVAHLPQGCCLAEAYGSGALWLLSGSGAVFRVDAKTNRVGKPIGVSGQGVAVAEGVVWVLDQVSARLVPIDAETQEPGEPILLNGDPFALAAGGGAVWVAGKDGTVQRITPGQGIDQVTLPGGPELNDIVFDPAGVWVVAPREGTVWKLDPDAPATNPRAFRVGGVPTEIAVDESGVWIVEESPATPIWES